MIHQLKIVQEAGRGQALVILSEPKFSNDYILDIFDKFADRFRVVHISVPFVQSSACSELGLQLEQLFKENSIRQVSLVGFEAAGSIVQAFVLKNRKMVRRIVLLNSTTRPHPSLRERFLAWAEKNLPLGLPFRLGSLAFDSRCFLQRIRCPALVLVTGDASQYVRQQAEYLSSHLPTSWFSELLRGSTLSEKIELFLDVPAKCPQKNR